MIAKALKSKAALAAAACLWAALGLANTAIAQNDAATTSSDHPPRILSSNPKYGATDVSPSLKEITITFDQDMDAGFSWVGGGPNFPKSPDGTKPRWRDDKRTCVLPVTLQPGHYYLVGINSQSFHGFCGANGQAVKPTTISFRTTGTPTAPKVPKIVKFDPPNGAQDVSAGIKELRVTFNEPMGGGFSWCGGGPNFPAGPEGQRPHWINDGKTCVLPVELKPGWQYELGLNSQSAKNFKSEDGLPLVPVVYSFKTSDK